MSRAASFNTFTAIQSVQRLRMVRVSLVKVCCILKRLTGFKCCLLCFSSGLDAGTAESLRWARMARLGLRLGELLVTGRQLRFWKCVVLALAMRRLRQCGSIERACVRMHTPADPSPGQDLSLRRLWIHVQSNIAEVRLASSFLVWHVNVCAGNLYQVLSTWLSQDASLV